MVRAKKIGDHLFRTGVCVGFKKLVTNRRGGVYECETEEHGAKVKSRSPPSCIQPMDEQNTASYNRTHREETREEGFTSLSIKHVWWWAYVG